MANFIKTNDESTAEKLREIGYPELPKQGAFFVFLNDGKHVATFDKSKVFKTDILTI